MGYVVHVGHFQFDVTKAAQVIKKPSNMHQAWPRTIFLQNVRSGAVVLLVISSSPG